MSLQIFAYKNDEYIRFSQFSYIDELVFRIIIGI